MARPKLERRCERDGDGNIIRLVVRAPEGSVIDEVVWIRGKTKWRCVVGLAKVSRRPARRKD
jgi:hypothetical protein